MTEPARSVIEMIVLLKLAWMCAWPTGMFFYSRRRVWACFLRSAMS
jgi:hypothetical protein